MEDLRVIKDKERDRYLIVCAEKIKKGRYCDCYDPYGNKLDCSELGCYCPENPDCDFQEGDDEEHIGATFIEYWDGHNWQSYILETDYDNDVALDGFLLPEDDETAKKILDEFEKAEFGDWQYGFCTAETENYVFTKSQFQGNFALATIE